MIRFTKYVVYSHLLAWECYDIEFETLKEAKREFEKQRKKSDIRSVTLVAKDDRDREYIIEEADKGIWLVTVTFTDNTTHYYRTPLYDKAARYFNNCQSDATIKSLKLHIETTAEKLRCEMWNCDYDG